MFVETIVPVTRGRLATIRDDALVTNAADFLMFVKRERVTNNGPRNANRLPDGITAATSTNLICG
jgi:hypothetical protein